MTVAQNPLLAGAYKLYHDSKEDVDGLKGKIENYGSRWIEVRFAFTKAGVSSTIDAVYSLAKAIFRTVWSATVGILFTNKGFRDGAVKAWKEVGTNVKDIGKSVVGIACPYLADRYFDNHAKTI